MRGKVKGCGFLALAVRITPACAGKSGRHALRHVLDGDHPRVCGKSAGTGSRSGASWDHPRVCGEKVGFVFQLACPLGSPPHVREKDDLVKLINLIFGITPACAGKSSLRWAAIQTHGDHPRVCGEKCPPGKFFFMTVGSPPRMRGKEDHPLNPRAGHWITPACAGKRKPPPDRHKNWGDHPRVCGEK